MQKQIQIINQKIAEGERITIADGEWLYRHADLAQLAQMAQQVREKWNGNAVFFNKNVHIEPTNICSNKCLFCSYRREEGEEGSWDLSLDEILAIAEKYQHSDITEVHIVGGVHPKHSFEFYKSIIAGVRALLPNVHIKAYTAEELWKMHEQSGLPLSEVLQQLQSVGLQSIPGGGAEVLNDTVRATICPQKINSATWLAVHETVHGLGLASNATLLYGHLETYEHRVEHLNLLRLLQDKTKGFNAFIPLKYKKWHNELMPFGEVSSEEDLRNMAICRIFLDNIPHIKAYWPMLGKALTLEALQFGADDLDGTIDESTQIYAMAGAEDKKPKMSVLELQAMAKKGGFKLVERNSLYGRLREFSE